MHVGVHAQVHGSLLMNVRSFDPEGDHQTLEVHLKDRDEVPPISRICLHRLREKEFLGSAVRDGSGSPMGHASR